VGDEINDGDDDGNPAQVDASWKSRPAQSQSSMRKQVWQPQATPLVNGLKRE